MFDLGPNWRLQSLLLYMKASKAILYVIHCSAAEVIEKGRLCGRGQVGFLRLSRRPVWNLRR